MLNHSVYQTSSMHDISTVSMALITAVGICTIGEIIIVVKLVMHETISHPKCTYPYTVSQTNLF